MIHTLLAAAAFMVLSGPQPDEKKDGAVRCDVQVIHATKGSPYVDPSIRPLSRYLKNSFGSRFTRFRRLEKSNMTLKVDARGTQSLPNSTKLHLTYLGVEDSLLRLVMEVGGLKTTVKVHDGGLFFQAGRKYKNGMLIVAVRAYNVD